MAGRKPWAPALPDEWRTVAGFQVNRIGIIGTDCIVYSVWEPSSLAGKHSSVTTNPFGEWVGEVSTREHPPEIKSMPVKTANGEYCEKRFAAIDAWRKGLYETCRMAIVAAFPEAAAGKLISGEIELWIEK